LNDGGAGARPPAPPLGALVVTGLVASIFCTFIAPEIPIAAAFANFKIVPNGSGIVEGADKAEVTPKNVLIVA